MEEERVSKDYVFKEKNGKMYFVGDFEAFYKNESDPWGQKGTDGRLNEYYDFSRSNLINIIGSLVKSEEKTIDILEVGCGLGYVLSKLSAGLPANVKVAGMDISKTAIKKAKSLFPSLEFIVGDICSKHLKVKHKYDIVIMSQILWYILEKLPQVFTNINSLLKNDGFLIFLNAFLKEQKYGKEIIDGFDGLVKYICLNYFGKYTIIKAEADYSSRFLHDDGILVLMKRG
jgi:SAM-dependent methyltransferase